MVKITISGTPGSGKTTVGKMLAKKYGYEFISIGKLRRDIAKEKNLTIQELNKIGEKESWTDELVDEKQKKMGESNRNFIFEGKISWYFIPNSIKLFLIVKKIKGAERILNEKRTSEQKCSGIEEQIKINELRSKSDIKRYNKIYGIENLYSKENYDIIIDTTNLTPREVYKKALKKIRLFQLKRFFGLD